MNELDSGSYEDAVHTPPADASYDANGSGAGAADNPARKEPGELLTRDEYADNADFDATDGDVPDHIEEADLAAIDAYDQAYGQIHEPLTRDEYTETADQENPADDGTSEHIEEADLTAIDAYDTAHEPAASRAQDEHPGEAPGGTITEQSEAAPPETEGATGQGAGQADHAGSQEADAGRISALEAKNADAQQRISELEAKNDEQAARLEHIEQRLAGSDRRPGDDADQVKDEQPARQLSGRARDVDESSDETSERQHNRRLPTDTQLALGGTITGSALSAAADYLSTVPAHTMGYIGSALAILVGAVAVVREKRKDENVRKREN